MVLNPYLDEYYRTLEHEKEAGELRMAWYDNQPSGYCWCAECLADDEREDGDNTRFKLIRKYAFAVPDDAAIKAIKGLQKPIVEIGAGNGYWAWMLEQAGVKVEAYDKPGKREYKQNTLYHAVFYEDGLEVLQEQRYKDYALMLCWPEYNDDFAYDCLRAFKGDWFIYIGEGEGGCNANDKFFEELEANWVLKSWVKIPQWSFVYDDLEIYQRRGTH